MKNKQNLKQFMRILDLEMVTLINILNAKGVIYTHYKQKQERENVCFRLQKKINLQNEFKKIR